MFQNILSHSATLKKEASSFYKHKLLFILGGDHRKIRFKVQSVILRCIPTYNRVVWVIAIQSESKLYQAVVSVSLVSPLHSGHRAQRPFLWKRNTVWSLRNPEGCLQLFWGHSQSAQRLFLPSGLKMLKMQHDENISLSVCQVEPLSPDPKQHGSQKWHVICSCSICTMWN